MLQLAPAKTSRTAPANATLLHMPPVSPRAGLDVNPGLGHGEARVPVLIHLAAALQEAAARARGWPAAIASGA